MNLHTAGFVGACGLNPYEMVDPLNLHMGVFLGGLEA